jgi:hypothetical protein
MNYQKALCLVLVHDLHGVLYCTNLKKYLAPTSSGSMTLQQQVVMPKESVSILPRHFLDEQL